MNELSDEELMKRYQKGDYMAFEALYLRHKDRIYSYLLRRLRDSNIASEVFQNTFMKFHKSKDRYNSKYPLITWLFTITRSELLDYVKTPKRDEIAFDEVLYKKDEFQVDFDLNLDEYKTLSDKERKAIELKFYNDEDYEEISALLDTSKHNARKLVSRGLAKIRKKLLGQRGSHE